MTFFQERQLPRQPFLLVPWPVLVLIGLLTIAYAAFALAPPGLEERILADFAFYPARYSHAFVLANRLNPGTLPEQALPFASYMFLHAGLSHLAVNSIWLLPFGSVVAKRFGAIRFFVFFFLCGIAGAGVHLAFNWGSTLPVIGASGAISGLMGAAFRMIRTYDGSTAGGEQAMPVLAPLFSRRIVIWSALWAVVNVVAGMTGLGAGTEVRLIAWQVHLGGYFAGLILAGPFAATTALRLERPGTDNK